MSGTGAKRSSTPPAELSHRWYLVEWCQFRGYRQADLERAMGWPRGKTNSLWSGKQRYTQESVDQASQWLAVEPYELLMPPEEAMNLRRLRETARAIAATHETYPLAAESGRPFKAAPPKKLSA